MGHNTEVSLRQEKGYRFAVDFGAGVPLLLADESPPLGEGSGPTPVQLLAAAVGNCLSDSLNFALGKFKQDGKGITTRVTATVDRNAEGRMRVVGIKVRVELGATADSIEHLDRALAQFEGFCTVAQSVGNSIPIEVNVYDGAGQQVK